MSKFSLRHEGFESITGLPNSFIENYMPTAAGEFVKIYIYLLKCINENCSELSVSRIADVFNNTEKDTIRALKYWARKGLLSLTFDGNTLTSLMVTSPAGCCGGSKAEGSGAGCEVKISHTPAHPTKKQYSKAEICAFKEDEDMRALQFSMTAYLGRTLTGTDINTLMFIRKDLGFDADLTEELIEYCVSHGHKDMRYIEKTAIGWSEQGIKTVKAAKLLREKYSDLSYPVMKAFGLTGRNLAKSEIDYINKWSVSWQFEKDMILEACERTIKKTHNPSFEYADSILGRWRAAGVTDLDGVKKADEVFKKEQTNKKSAASKTQGGKALKTPFNSFSQRTYDFKELEKKLLEKSEA